MKQKTLEEAAEQFEYTDGIYGFKQGAKWQAERMYSEEEMKYNKNVYFQPDFSCEETLITPDGVELWSYYVYASFDNARRDFPNRQIIAYKGDDIEDPYFIDGNGKY